MEAWPPSAVPPPSFLGRFGETSEVRILVREAAAAGRVGLCFFSFICTLALPTASPVSVCEGRGARI